jgi:hypothetical protein
MRSREWIAMAALALAGCGGDDQVTYDAPPGTADGPMPDGPPANSLAATGLCANATCSAVQPGVRAFEPRFQLYSDGATKKRWILLPAGQQIDTSDMDYWNFPVGTKLWKEFTRDGTRVETRLMEKTGAAEDEWEFTPYIWNAAQDSAIATPMGQDDANGTMHDVPSRAECRQCHDRQDGGGLGFSAIQLDVAQPEAFLDLDELVAMDLLTDPPAGTTPRYPLPGDETAINMLGYAHANCGHCHNPTSDVFNNFDLDMRLRVGALATAEGTPLYTSSIGVLASPPVNGATHRVTPQSLADSVVYQRFITDNISQRMPKLGTEVADPVGQGIIESWIGALPL